MGSPSGASSAVMTFAVILCIAQFISISTAVKSYSFSSSENDFHHGWGEQTEQADPYAIPSVQTRLHPLDPLTEAEINRSSSIIRNFRRGSWRFNYIALKEPEKSTLLSYFLKDTNPQHIPRKSFSVVVSEHNYQIYEVVVNLDRGQVESWNAVQSKATANLIFTPDEVFEAERVAREDHEVIERSRKLGWTDMNLVNADSWSVGSADDRPEFQGKRLINLYIYGKNFEEDNQYAHPFDFCVVVDLNEMRVVAVVDLPTHEDYDASNKKGNTVPRATANYEPELRDPNSYRDDVHPISVSQKYGPSFTVTGNEIKWQKFKMRIGFNGREGLVIYNVNYNDAGKVRPLFYRMSLAEMFVPYGDPRTPYHWKQAFDAGQYGIGMNTNELKPQIDCIGEVHFFDGVLHNDKGEAYQLPRAICVHEEDAGILWKHTDYRSKRSAIVRSQRLSITFIATVANYEYIYTWHFSQDGTIEFIVKMTGIMSVNLLAVNATSVDHGSVVFPQINAQFHQHFFSLRLDAEIDGNKNSVVMSDVVSLSASTGSRQNPYGQGFTTRNTLLKTAGTARTSVSTENGRTWNIINSNFLNPYSKQPVSWKLIPWPTQLAHVRRDSPYHPKSEFIDYNTWVTPYQENQLFSGGLYLNNSGLPEWVGRNKNANIDNTDIVFWHNFGISHITCPEDFPVMPVKQCGVTLKPTHFFKENPALDVPPPRASRDEL